MGGFHQLIRNSFTKKVDRSGAIFMLLIIWVLSSFTSAYKAVEKLYRIRWCVAVVQGHSRSSKLVPIESPYATSY